ncbi:TonB-dependent receptor plug domain-containing protein [Sphingobium yanoikuyae]|jgi:iron complex outermembrane receptor protein|uniref:TonB-dependent receptor plug domain-containing protein n=1 Tax=Sphingobium yanoikuyae TaxID=13690 RepID=UPI001F35D924|nr:TonB-dependent receptor [Sphingobium yanoikuyae]
MKAGDCPTPEQGTGNVKTFSKRALLRASAAPAILGASLIATAAFAQEAPQGAEAEATDTIVVTGSLIKNPNLERSTPVTATTSDQIELKQNNTAEEILREIPGVVPSIGSAVNNGNGGASLVDLRGLGSFRNIVLIDGSRLAPSGLAGQFDLNNIPLALVERVEVLTGGASTTYGADAISGVVNFITKSDFSGLEANVSNQLTEQGDGNYFRADVTLGANFDDGRGNVVFSVGYQQADPVYQGDRSFSQSSIDSFSGANGGSGTSTPSRFGGVNVGGLDSITTGCGGTGQVACTSVQGTRQLTADGGAFRPTSAFDAYNFNPFNIFQTPFKRFNMYGAGRYELSDAVEVYSRGVFSKNTVSTIIAPSGAFGIPVTFGLDNPFLTDAQRNAFCAFDVDPRAGYRPRFTQAECDARTGTVGSASASEFVAADMNGDGVIGEGEGFNSNPAVTVNRRATELGPRISDFTTTFFDYKIGARGGITDSISWDLSGAYGESEQIQTQKGYWLNSRVQQALLATSTTECVDDSNGCVPLNLFGPDGSITDAMNSFLNANSQVTTKTSLAQVKGVISGDFGVAVPFASDAVAFAVGGEYRKYTASQESDLLSQSGDLGGAGGAAPNINGGYDVYEAYGELVLPLVQDKPFFEDLTAEAGIRYSDYSVQGGSGYNTTTWKAGLNWTPVNGLKLRGNYSHAVRAPNISELFSPLNTVLTNLASDPCAGAAPTQDANLAAICVAQGATLAQIGSIINDPAGQVNTTTGGNLALGPEKSNSYTFGVVLQPSAVPGLAITVDYYNIKITGAITTPTPDDVIDACFGNVTAASASSEACTVIRRDPSTGGLYGLAANAPGLYQPLSNLGKLKTDGIDVSINYSKDIGFAKWALNANGNWTNSSTFQATPTSINRDCVGLYSANCASIQPEFQWSVRNTLSFGMADVSLLWRYIDGVKYEFGDAFVGELNGKQVDFNRIPAEHYFDLTGRFHASDEITFTLTVQNLLNNKPKVVGNTIGSTSYNSGNVYPSTYDALGRRYAVSAKFRF